MREISVPTRVFDGGQDGFLVAMPVEDCSPDDDRDGPRSVVTYGQRLIDISPTKVIADSDDEILRLDPCPVQMKQALRKSNNAKPPQPAIIQAINPPCRNRSNIRHSSPEPMFRSNLFNALPGITAGRDAGINDPLQALTATLPVLFQLKDVRSKQRRPW